MRTILERCLRYKTAKWTARGKSVVIALSNKSECVFENFLFHCSLFMTVRQKAVDENYLVNIGGSETNPCCLDLGILIFVGLLVGASNAK